MTVPSLSAPDARPWVERFVRTGYAAKGAIYVLMGALALRVALGEGGRLTDANGALDTVVRQPFGRALLLIIGIGLLAYAAWEITQAAINAKHRRSDARGWMDRGLSVIKGLVYGGLGWQAVQMFAGGRGGSTDTDGYARETMQLPFGRALLMAIGAGIAIYGVKQVLKAWRSQFDDDLDQTKLRREGGAYVLNVGRAGIGARGVILTLVGGALVHAGATEAPSRAAGAADAMRTLFVQPYGHWLLAAVAAGIICYGVFQLLHARYARL